jgi:hypothetical protein
MVAIAAAWSRPGMSRNDLPAALIAEAKKRPGGWVYEVVGDYATDDAVPPAAVRGAWRVDDDGQIVGDFIPNPGFESPLQDP